LIGILKRLAPLKIGSAGRRFPWELSGTKANFGGS